MKLKSGLDAIYAPVAAVAVASAEPRSGDVDAPAAAFPERRAMHTFAGAAAGASADPRHGGAGPGQD